MVDKHSNACKSVEKSIDQSTMLNKAITKICVLKHKLTAQTVQPSQSRWDSPDQYCLKIPNPNQYAIRIGKIPILKSLMIFSDEFL